MNIPWFENLTENQKRFVKSALKDAFNQRPFTPQPSLFGCNWERYRHANTEDGYIEYGYITLHGELYTDEELQDEIDRMTVSINTMYDCSGELFTYSIRYHRNPCGAVSFVHEMHLDI